MPIFVLYGVDELGRGRRLAELKEEADGGSGMLDSNLTEVDGRDAKVGDIISPAMVAPFLAPKRMVVVSSLVDRYRPDPGRRGRRRAGFGAMDDLFPALEQVPESTVLVFTGGDRDRFGNAPRGENAFVARMRDVPGTRVEQFDELSGKDLVRFVKEEAAARGVHFKQGKSTRPFLPEEEWLRPKETDPAVLLAALHPGDTLGLANELQKLALYAKGADVTVDDVDVLCAGERSTQIWDFTDAVIDGDLAKAISARNYLEKHGWERGGLMFQLMREYKNIAIAGELTAEGASPDEIGKAIGARHPFPRDKAIARAKRLGRAGVEAAYFAMVETDRAKKAGEVEDDAGMHVLINRLCAIGAARR